eukprot:Skav214242  [mRNA]  locus=scaffold2045:31241:41574:+ [translate_table: standard]
MLRCHVAAVIGSNVGWRNRKVHDFPFSRCAMLVSPELMVQLGPPPQEILEFWPWCACIDQQWLWKLLMFGFSLVLILQLTAVDIAGVMLTGLLLAFGTLVSRARQPGTAVQLLEIVLCGLNFFFEVLPLFSELNGRVTRTALSPRIH